MSKLVSSLVVLGCCIATQVNASIEKGSISTSLTCKDGLRITSRGTGPSGWSIGLHLVNVCRLTCRYVCKSHGALRAHVETQAYTYTFCGVPERRKCDAMLRGQRWSWRGISPAGGHEGVLDGSGGRGRALCPARDRSLSGTGGGMYSRCTETRIVFY